MPFAFLVASSVLMWWELGLCEELILTVGAQYDQGLMPRVFNLESFSYASDCHV